MHARLTCPFRNLLENWRFPGIQSECRAPELGPSFRDQLARTVNICTHIEGKLHLDAHTMKRRRLRNIYEEHERASEVMNLLLNLFHDEMLSGEIDMAEEGKAC